jgi:exonuclease VII small subunit
MRRWESLRGTWQAAARWRDDVVAELAKLPDTLRQFRDGVTNFQVVAKRLADGTEALEQLTELYSAGVSDRVRQLSDAATTLQRQLGRAKTARPPGADRLEQAVEDFNRTVAALAELNPFLRSRRS